MPKHVVLIGPHSAMIDCVNLHDIKYTIVDHPENKTSYNDQRYHSLLLFDYSNVRMSIGILEGLHKACYINAHEAGFIDSFRIIRAPGS